jgi:hypothetical protein
LYEPWFKEIFWCPYQINLVSEVAKVILQTKSIWIQVEYIVKDSDGHIPNQHTFSGGDYV